MNKQSFTQHLFVEKSQPIVDCCEICGESAASGMHGADVTVLKPERQMTVERCPCNEPSCRECILRPFFNSVDAAIREDDAREIAFRYNEFNTVLTTLQQVRDAWTCRIEGRKVNRPTLNWLANDMAVAMAQAKILLDRIKADMPTKGLEDG